MTKQNEDKQEMTEERLNKLVAASAANADSNVDPMVADAIAKARAIALSTNQVTAAQAVPQEAIQKANAMAAASPGLPGLAGLGASMHLPGMPMSSPPGASGGLRPPTPRPLTPMGKRPTLMMPKGAMAKPAMPMKSVIDKLPGTSKATMAPPPSMQASLASAISNVNAASAMNVATAKNSSPPGLNGSGQTDGLLALPPPGIIAQQTAPAAGQLPPIMTPPAMTPPAMTPPAMTPPETAPPATNGTAAAGKDVVEDSASLDASFQEMSPALAALMGMMS